MRWSSHLIELIGLSVPGPHDPSPVADRAVRAARLAALKADIARHFGDPELSVAAVAARHGISPRYVHKLFEGDGRTYSQFVLDVRLERAREESGPARRHANGQRDRRATWDSATCPTSTGRSAGDTG